MVTLRVCDVTPVDPLHRRSHCSSHVQRRDDDDTPDEHTRTHALTSSHIIHPLMRVRGVWRESE
jgi:hypothetical protein